jgi:hypothetical protein
MRRSALSLVSVVGFTWICSACTSQVSGSSTPAASTVTVVSVQTVTPAPGVRVFDESVVQQGIVSILKDQYMIADVKSAKCPSDQPVKVGKTFECTVVVGGETMKVKITTKSADGEFEVGQPKR